MKDFIKKYIYLLISIPLILIIIGLWLLDYKNQSVNLTIIGLAIWFVKYLLDRHNQKIEKQNQIILQRSQGGNAFKQNILEEMYNVTMELWKQSVWIGNNWDVLFPGFDKYIKERNNFNKKLDEYRFLLQSNLINIPSEIYNGFDDLIKGIDKYKHARNLKDGKHGEPTKKHITKAVHRMDEGSKMVEDSIKKLSITIRKKFCMDNLPGELLDIKTTIKF